MIRIGLIGFGKTGKEVARELLLDKSVKLVCVFKYHDTYVVNEEVGWVLGLESTGVKVSLSKDFEEVIKSAKPDVIIDFAAKRSILHYLDTIAKYNVNVVICSTGYNKDQINVIKEYGKQVGIVHAPNVTDGINILARLSRLVKENWPEADISVIETHFSGKKDVSATALNLANKIRDTEDVKVGRKKDSVREDNEIIIHKVRTGGVIGQHQVIFGNSYQTITLTHNTISRLAFGRGAIRAAHWILGKKGFYGMEDVISL